MGLVGTCTCEKGGEERLELGGDGGGGDHAGVEVHVDGEEVEEGEGMCLHNHQNNMVQSWGSQGLELLVTSRWGCGHGRLTVARGE